MFLCNNTYNLLEWHMLYNTLILVKLKDIIRSFDSICTSIEFTEMTANS